MRHCNGIALINTLLLLFLLSLTLLCCMESANVQSRLTANTSRRIAAEMLAESVLLATEYRLQGIAVSTDGLTQHVDVKDITSSVPHCRQETHLLNVTASYRGAVVRVDADYRPKPLQLLESCTKVSGQLWWSLRKDL